MLSNQTKITPGTASQVEQQLLAFQQEMRHAFKNQQTQIKSLLETQQLQSDMLIALSNNNNNNNNKGGGQTGDFGGNDNNGFFDSSPGPLDNDGTNLLLGAPQTAPHQSLNSLLNGSLQTNPQQSLLLGAPQTAPQQALNSLLNGSLQTNLQPVNKHRLSIADTHNPATMRATEGTSSADLVDVCIKPTKIIICDAVTDSYLKCPYVIRMAKERFLDYPLKCSSREVGYEAIITEEKMTTYKQQKNITAPWLSKALFMQGSRPVSFVLLLVSQVAALIYICKSIQYGISPEVSSIHLVEHIIISILYFFINMSEVKAYATKATVWTQAVEESYLSESSFLMMFGLDTSVRNEDDIRNGEGTNKHLTVKNKLTRDALLKSFFCVFLPAQTSVFPVLYSIMEHYNAGEWDLMGLCAGAFFSRFCIAISGLTIAFCVYLNQSVHIFELKKLQHDIRNCTIEEIPLIFPRVKRLLDEIHQVCNKAHVFFIVNVILCFSGVVMLMASIYNLNVTNNEHYEVPVWIIIGVVPHLSTTLSYYVGFAELNRITERDIDEDLNDLLFRLQFAVGHDERFVRNNSEKLKILIRKDSRVCILPFHIIPDHNTAKQLISYVFSACVVLAPYVLAMRSQLILGYLSMEKD